MTIADNLTTDRPSFRTIAASQRKCHNCRFYREAEFPASGWCCHPEREALQDLVLVRKWELACRTMSDDDLWEASAAYLASTLVHEYLDGVH